MQTNKDMFYLDETIIPYWDGSNSLRMLQRLKMYFYGLILF